MGIVWMEFSTWSIYIIIMSYVINVKYIEWLRLEAKRHGACEISHRHLRSANAPAQYITQFAA